MSKIYVVGFDDDYSIFATFKAALKPYIESCVLETRSLFDDVSEDQDVSISGTLKIYELDEEEYELVKTYDLADFQAFLDTREEDLEEYLDKLEESDEFPDEIYSFYQA